MDSTDLYLDIGEKIRARRQSLNMTIEELSTALNKSISTVSKYERGTVQISIDVLVDICRILRLDIFSLLPDTMDEEPAGNAERYRKHIADRMYIYWYNGDKKRVQLSVAENNNHAQRSVLYYDVHDISDPHKCNYMYSGHIYYSDSSTSWVFQNQDPPFDTITLWLPALSKKNSPRIGLLSCISYFYQAISMKVLASETPVSDEQQLIESLRVNQEDIKNLKRTNFFMIL